MVGATTHSDKIFWAVLAKLQVRFSHAKSQIRSNISPNVLLIDGDLQRYDRRLDGRKDWTKTWRNGWYGPRVPELFEQRENRLRNLTGATINH